MPDLIPWPVILKAPVNSVYPSPVFFRHINGISYFDALAAISRKYPGLAFLTACRTSVHPSGPQDGLPQKIAGLLPDRINSAANTPSSLE